MEALAAQQAHEGPDRGHARDPRQRATREHRTHGLDRHLEQHRRGPDRGVCDRHDTSMNENSAAATVDPLREIPGRMATAGAQPIKSAAIQLGSRA